MKKKVLIVEDVADVRAMMEVLVEMYGYQAITADDGYDAIGKVQEHHPDLKQGDKEAEQRFREIQAAYDVLKRAEERRVGHPG